MRPSGCSVQHKPQSWELLAVRLACTVLLTCQSARKSASVARTRDSGEHEILRGCTCFRLGLVVLEWALPHHHVAS